MKVYFNGKVANIKNFELFFIDDQEMCFEIPSCDNMPDGGTAIGDFDRLTYEDGKLTFHEKPS